MRGEAEAESHPQEETSETSEKGKQKMKEAKKKGRTVYLNKKHTPDSAKWVAWLEKKCLASAGPRPCIRGMRKVYWGDYALLVKAGAYLYLLKREDDFKPLPWE